MKTKKCKSGFLPACITSTLTVVLILFSCCVYAGERDTVLNAVYSHPFFYNVLANKKGTVFTGTSQGIFQLQGTELVLYKKEAGYITLGKNGEPVVNAEGIKNYYERTYVYLLPFPEQARDEYHAGAKDFFYICSGGRIYIYDIVPYSYSFANHSIRTISENFTGTYSGIYYKGNRLGKPAPAFTDGYIREINGAAYICFDWLLSIDSLAVNSGKIDSTTISFSNYAGNIQFRDVYLSKKNPALYFSSVTDLLAVNRAGVMSSIYKTKNKISEIVLIGENKRRIYVSDGGYVLGLDAATQQIDTITRLPFEVVDGAVNDRNVYLLTNEGVYQLSSDNETEKLVPVSQAHTLELVSTTEMVIATNNGLFSFNTVNKALTPLIRGIEFNRKALFKKGDLLQAGSINGLYTINVNDLKLIAERNIIAEKEPLPVYIFVLLLPILAIVVLLFILLLKARKKLEVTTTQLKELNVDVLSREKIEDYIRENLATASLKSITDHFNTNNNHIYKLIEPDRPGSIIQKMRIEKLIKLQKEGRDIEAIAAATGLSVSYLKKIRNKI